MSQRATTVFGYLVLAIILAAIWVMFGEDPSREQGGRGEALFPDAAQQISKAQQLSVSSDGKIEDGQIEDGQLVSVERSGDQWIVSSHSGYPADSALVARVLRGMVIVKRKEPKTANAERMVKLGLGDGGRRVVLLDEAAKPLLAFQLGKHRTWQGDASLSYIFKESDTRAWEVTGLAEIPKTAQGWLKTSVLTLDDSRIQSMTYPDGTQFQKSVDGAAFTAVTPLKDGETITSPWAVETDARRLAGFTLVDVVPLVNPLDPPKASVQLKTHDGLVVTYTVHAVSGDDLVKIAVRFIAHEDMSDEAKAQGQLEARALNAAVAPWAFKVAEQDQAIFTKSRSDLIATAPAQPATEK